MIEVVKEEVTQLFCDHPLTFLNERDFVSDFQMRLLKRYPDTVTLTVKTLSDRFPSLQPTKFITRRVHQEVATEAIGRGKRVDIAILKGGGAELVGFNYRPRIPSTVFRDQDVIGAIELKFFRDTDEREKILRASELNSFEASIRKLEIISGGIPPRSVHSWCSAMLLSASARIKRKVLASLAEAPTLIWCSEVRWRRFARPWGI